MDSTAISMMTYDASKKSCFPAYLLWFFFGGFGAHRFYTRTTGAFIQPTLLICGIVAIFSDTSPAGGIGIAALVFLYLWILADAFMIPGMVKRHNLKLANSLAAS